MKIKVDYNDQAEEKLLKIDLAQYKGDYVVWVHFTDGTEKSIDFKPFLTNSLHPSIKKYLDKNEFKHFKIVDGNLNWNDYEMIFPVWDLYNGKI